MYSTAVTMPEAHNSYPVSPDGGETHGVPPFEADRPYVEAPYLSEADRRLARLWTPSPELAAALRTKIEDAVDLAVSTAFDPHERDSLLTQGKIWEWHLLRPAEPPPAEVVLTATPDGEYRLRSDSSTGYTYHCSVAADQRLLETGMAQVVDELRGHLEARKPLIAASMADVVREQPEYALLQSFDVRPPATPQEAPLPPHVFDEREQQIRTEARLRHGMAGHEQLRTNLNARRTVVRGIQYLEEETMPRMQEAEAIDAKQRAREFYLGKIKQSLESKGHVVTRIEYSAQQDVILEIRPRGQADVVRLKKNRFIDALDNAMEEEVTGGEAAASAKHAARVELLQSVGVRLFDDAFKDVSYQQIISEAIDKMVSYLSDYVIANIDTADYSEAAYELAQIRHIMAGPFVGNDELDDMNMEHQDCSFYDSVQEPQFMDREKFDRLRDTTIGSVIFSQGGVPAGRLIMRQDRSPDIPLIAETEPDLVLILSQSEEWDKADPLIPGYRLVSRAYGRYEFVREVEDPYARSTDPVNDEQRRKAAEHARRVHMDGLAEAISSEPALTTGRLAELIESFTDYYIPEARSLPAKAQDFDDFVQFVQSGRMRQQCDFASRFQQLFFEGVFGPGTMSVISGYVIDAEGEVPMLRHAQNVYRSASNQLHIIDSTPPSYELNIRPVARRATTGASAPAAKPMTSVERSSIGRPTQVAEPDPEVLRLRRMQDAGSMLEHRIQMVFGLRDRTALAEKLVTLPASDPLRRAVEVTRAVIRGDARPGEQGQLVAALRRIMAADERTLKSWGITAYDPAALMMVFEGVGAFVVASLPTAPSEASKATAATHSGARRSGRAAETAAVRTDISVHAVKDNVLHVVEQLPADELVLAAEAFARAIGQLEYEVSRTDVTSSVYDIMRSLNEAVKALPVAQTLLRTVVVEAYDFDRRV